MRRLTMLLMCLGAAGALGACGEDETTEDKADRPAATSEEKPRKPKKEKPQTLTQCLEDSGFEVERRDRDLIRAKDPASGAMANITTFPTKAEARKFADQLEVPGTQSGKLVAVYFSDENPTKTKVDTCVLTVG